VQSQRHWCGWHRGETERMTGTDLRRRREALGLSYDQLADVLHEHPDQIAEWEGITGALPGSLSRRLDWVLANEGRIEAIRAAGVEDCQWVERRLQGASAHNLKDLQRRLAEVEIHGTSCPTCQRRKAFVASLPPLPTPPLPATVRLIGTIIQRVGRLPRWSRPAAWGAIGIGALAVVRVLLMVALGRVALSGALLLLLAQAIGLGAYGGAVGGGAYALVRSPLRRYGRLGDYLTGLACAYSYVLAFGLPIAWLTREPMLQRPEGWLILAAAATVFGLIIGHSWFREASPPSPHGT